MDSNPDMVGPVHIAINNNGILSFDRLVLPVNPSMPIMGKRQSHEIAQVKTK